jgi:hypothetical protein
VLRSISVYRHAAVITPVARWALIARGTAYSNCFPVPSGCGLPSSGARSASTLVVSRPAQRSLAITACRLAESPIATRLSRRLRRFRFLHRRSDSYRLERPSCRVRNCTPLKTNTLHGSRRTPDLTRMAPGKPIPLASMNLRRIRPHHCFMRAYIISPRSIRVLAARRGVVRRWYGFGRRLVARGSYRSGRSPTRS